MSSVEYSHVSLTYFLRPTSSLLWIRIHRNLPLIVKRDLKTENDYWNNNRVREATFAALSKGQESFFGFSDDYNNEFSGYSIFSLWWYKLWTSKHYEIYKKYYERYKMLILNFLQDSKNFAMYFERVKGFPIIPLFAPWNIRPIVIKL